MVETDGGYRHRRLGHHKGVWSPLCSGLTYSNRSNSLLTDLQEKHTYILLDEKALTFSKLLQEDFNTRKLARDEGDQNL